MDQITPVRVFCDVLDLDLCEDLGAAPLGNRQVIGIERIFCADITARDAITTVDAFALFYFPALSTLALEVDYNIVDFEQRAVNSPAALLHGFNITQKHCLGMLRGEKSEMRPIIEWSKLTVLAQSADRLRPGRLIEN